MTTEHPEHSDSDDFVQISADLLSGAPAVRGTRVFASTVRELGWDAGLDYDLDDYTISGVLSWWEKHGADWPDGRRLSGVHGCVVDW